MADERDIPHFNKMANESKQTAVEWLFEQLLETPKDKLNWYAILYQAKEMEKVQIIDAAKWLPKPFETIEFIQELAKQYYQQTFGK
jgi:hypothetical protein